MRAVVQDRYGPPGDVLRVENVSRPVPGDDEVLFRVHAAAVHPDVWHVVTGHPLILKLMGNGVSRPKYRIPGTDAAGVVEAVGRNVTRFALGDEVFGETHLGFQWKNGGAYAEYVTAPEGALALKPARVTFEQAASVSTSGIIALFNLPDEALLSNGRRVLVNGAGGGVGSIVVQVAKACGAHVTAVDCARKLGMLTDLGADEVIDHTERDFTQGEAKFDLIYDVASNLKFSRCKRVLTRNGMYVVIGHDHFGAASGRTFGSVPKMLALALRSPFDRHLPSNTGASIDKRALMARLERLLSSGQVSPIIDRSFPLEKVAEALHYLQAGEPLGRVLITPNLLQA